MQLEASISLDNGFRLDPSSAHHVNIAISYSLGDSAQRLSCVWAKLGRNHPSSRLNQGASLYLTDRQYDGFSLLTGLLKPVSKPSSLLPNTPMVERLCLTYPITSRGKAFVTLHV